MFIFVKNQGKEAADILKVKKKSSLKGKLRIGDQWNAISIIARSQTNILKAVCELVENSIDAGARNIQIIRKRKDKFVYLEVLDDGKGIKLDEGGNPDFKYVATHICDSLKRYLSLEERAGIHGEFGIGLLGFWSLGRELHIYAKGKGAKTFEMAMKAGRQSFNVYPSRMDLLGYGVRVIIGPLHATTKNVLTGERLQKYLSIELRDRLRRLKVNLSIFDKVARKKLKVVPKIFSGEKVTELSRLFSPLGSIMAELYYVSNKEEKEAFISLSKDGTRVKKSICELENFDHEPWNSGFFEGIIDCPFLNLTPGTRDSVVHDDKYHILVQKLADVEKSLVRLMEQRKAAEAEQASRTILKEVRKAFIEALNNLPQNEYIWFDVEKEIAGNDAGAGPVNGVLKQKRQKPEAIPSFLDDLPGEPVRLTVTPKISHIMVGESKTLRVKVFDGKEREVTDHLEYFWELIQGEGIIAQVEENACVFRAPSHATNAVIAVRVQYGKQELNGSCKIKVSDTEPEEGASHSIGQGLPSYRLISGHGEHWRSKYNVKKNLIEVNSAHRDFISAKQSLTAHKRYIAKLYAKEIVILNFPNVNQSDSLERIIELLVRIEKVL